MWLSKTSESFPNWAFLPFSPELCGTPGYAGLQRGLEAFSPSLPRAVRDSRVCRAPEGSSGILSLSSLELCGTPGYLAPEILKCSMDETHPGYGKEVDL